MNQNFFLKLEAMHSVYKEIPEYSSSFMQQFVCPNPREDCWFNSCEKCKDALIFQQAYPIETFTHSHNGDVNENITWYQWVSEESKTKDGKTMVHYTKKKEENSFIEIYDKFISTFNEFKTHHFIKRNQEMAYENNKKALDETGKKAVIQFDFAENYASLWQDEIQNAHFHKIHLTVFTGIIWCAGNSDSYVVVSDNLCHDKHAIVPFLSHLLFQLPATVTNVTLWSDGPRTQFKNRFLAKAILFLEKMHNIVINWRFFAAGHGKGPVDGIGGTVKRYVASKVLRRQQDRVNDLESFVAASSGCKVFVHPISKDNIEEFNTKHNMKTLFEQADVIKGISKAHEIEIVEEKITLHRYSALEQNDKTVSDPPVDFNIANVSTPIPAKCNRHDKQKIVLKHNKNVDNCHVDRKESNFRIHDWCAVYISQYCYWYVGKIIDKKESSLIINFLQQIKQSKNYFEAKDDIVEVQPSDIFFKLSSEPQPLSFSRRSKVMLNRDDFEQVELLFFKKYSYYY